MAHFLKKSYRSGLPPELRGFDCAYHYVAPGLNPKHNIYAFSIELNWI